MRVIVTVPTFESLPTTQLEKPSVNPQTPIDRMQLGMLKEPGEATERLGSAIESDAAETAKIGQAMATQQNEDASKQAAMDGQKYRNNLGYTSMGQGPDGQPLPGFYAMKGQQAASALPQYIAAIQKQRDDATQGMSVQQKNIYLAHTDPEIMQETATAQRYGMLQTLDAAKETSLARSGLAAQTAVLNSNDDDKIAANAKTIYSEAVERGRMAGFAPDSDFVKNDTLLHQSDMYKNVIESRLARGDVAGAGAGLEKYQGLMTGTDQVNTAGRLKEPLLKLHAQQLGDSIVPPTSSADAPYTPGSGYYDAVHPGEGDGRPTTGHSASGPLQVQPGTLDDFHAAGHANVDVNTEAGAREFSKWYGDQNAKTISDATGQPATNGQVWAAHLLGPGGAKALLANPDAPIGKTLASTTIEANRAAIGPDSQTGAQALQHIQNYYAGAAAKSASPASVAAATSSPRPDYESGIAKVPLDPKDPDLHDATVRYLETQARQYDLGQQTDQANIIKGGPGKPGLGDLKSTLENGGDVNLGATELALRHAFKPGQADALMEELNDAKAVGGVVNSSKYALPADLDAKHTDLIAAAGPNGPVEGHATAAKTLTTFERAMAVRAEALKKDPADYVRQEPTVAPLATAYQTNPTPENLAAYITRSENVQRSLGVAPRAVTKPTLDSIVASLHGAKVEDVPGKFNDYQKQYGAAWPDVARDLMDPQRGKLDPGYQPLLTMAPGAGRTDYAAALVQKNEKGEKFGAAMDGAYPGAKTTLESQINTSMDRWRNSFPGASGSGTIEGQTQAVRTLATYYADTRGMEPGAAAKRAYDMVLGNVDVNGSIRAPKTINGQPFGADKVIDAGQTVQQNLTQDKLLPEGRQGFVTVDQARAGQWVTNQDGMSVSLMVPRATGGTMLVLGKDGKPITMDYKSLPSADPQRPGQNIPGVN